MTKGLKRAFWLWAVGGAALCFFSSAFANAAAVNRRLYSQLSDFHTNRKIIEVDGVPCLKIFLPKGQSLNSFCRSVKYFEQNYYFYRQRIALINRLEPMAVVGATGNLSTDVNFIYVPLNFSVRPQILPEWFEPVSKLPKFILINLHEQCLGLYQYGKLIHQFPISSGTHGVPAKKFTILSKEKDHYSTLYNNAWMPYALRLFGNYYLHAGILPGYPASHGCVRLLYDNAIVVYNWAQVGTPGEVINGTPKPEEKNAQAQRVKLSPPMQHLSLPLR